MTEMLQCVDELENVLLKLDTMGAGIAAIHVDAAIEHLRGNLATIEKQDGPAPALELEYAYARTRIVH